MRKKVTKTKWILIIVVLVLVFLVGLDIWKNASNSGKEYLLSVNSFPPNSNDNKSTPYLIFQVSFPSRYYATSGDMLIDYKASKDLLKSIQMDNGAGSPRIFLNTNMQPLGLAVGSQDSLSERSKVLENNNCIMIYSSTHFSSIDDWTNALIFGYQILKENEHKTKIGKYDVIERNITVKYGGVNYRQAVIALRENVSYYFNTCNMNSSKDLETVLKTFDVRGII